MQFFFLENLKNRLLPINVGTGIEISILNLAKKIKKIVGFNGNIEFDKEKPDGALRKILDSQLNGLGWKYTYTVDDALKLTYKWYIENYEHTT